MSVMHTAMSTIDHARALPKQNGVTPVCPDKIRPYPCHRMHGRAPHDRESPPALHRRGTGNFQREAR